MQLLVIRGQILLQQLGYLLKKVLVKSKLGALVIYCSFLSRMHWRYMHAWQLYYIRSCNAYTVWLNLGKELPCCLSD